MDADGFFAGTPDLRREGCFLASACGYVMELRLGGAMVGPLGRIVGPIVPSRYDLQLELVQALAVVIPNLDDKDPSHGA